MIVTKPEQSAIVLIAEADQQVKESLRILISSLGYKCLTAADGMEAAEILNKHDCNIVLCELLMPEIDGMELLTHILAHYFDTDVIIATGCNNRVRYADVIRAGAIDFIKKPIDQAELEAKLARAIREREMIRKLEALSLSDGLTSLLSMINIFPVRSSVPAPGLPGPYRC